jgi:hypothetical protein
MNKRIANSPAKGVLKKPDPRGSPRENNFSGSSTSQQTGTRINAESSESEMDDMLSHNSRRNSNSSQRTIVEDQPDMVDPSCRSRANSGLCLVDASKKQKRDQLDIYWKSNSKHMIGNHSEVPLPKTKQREKSTIKSWVMNSKTSTESNLVGKVVQ